MQTEAKKPTQTERVLEYLKKNETINPLQAWNRLGVYRLGACICTLRALGHSIDTERVEVKNQFNEPCSFGNYRLVKLFDGENAKLHNDAGKVV